MNIKIICVFVTICFLNQINSQAASCHVRWNTPSGSTHGLAVEIKVEANAPATYYMATGFHAGYGGIQQQYNPLEFLIGSKQWFLFSLWDYNGGKAQNLSLGSGFWNAGFGGEGTGVKAYAESNSGSGGMGSWKVGSKYMMVVRAFQYGSGTRFKAWIHRPETNQWHEMAEHYRNENTYGKLTGLYSFIEDFAGNGQYRSAIYSAWYQENEGWDWKPVNNVQGTSTNDGARNKRVVRVIRDGCEAIEMASGGGAMGDSSLYGGYLGNPCPVPWYLANFK